MGKLQIKPKQLLAFGFPQNAAISMTMTLVDKEFKHATLEEIEPILRGLAETPEKYWDDETWSKIAERIKPRQKQSTHVALRDKGLPFEVFGADGIENEAWVQMKVAMKLPVAVAGALMPDAHAGYGLPIGGVLATENAVIPYGVGVDIGCRMCLSVFPIAAVDFEKHAESFKKVLLENTIFGAGGEWSKSANHEITDRPLFNELPILKNLARKADRQLGTSGGGNHFVEFGLVNFPKDDRELGIKTGDYVALLSHSGSRGLGATIAKFYTDIAMKKRQLPTEARHLAWLMLDEADGAEYWAAMNLAGDYASACHDEIHRKIMRALGTQARVRVENHHNFAWKERLADGREVITHRKGATPANVGELGIIPGSMTAAGYIVRGLGNADALNSAAHGAGRAMSRRKAKENITNSSWQKMLRESGVTLFGGGIDEAPLAYKNIESVMSAQTDLVEIIGRFLPKIVRMAGD